MLASIIMESVYGIRDHDMIRNYIAQAGEVISEFGEAKMPGRYWIQFLPLLKHVPTWVPGAAVQALGSRVRRLVTKIRDEPYDVVLSGQVISNRCI